MSRIQMAFDASSWHIAEKCGVLIRREPTPEAAITQKMLDEYRSGNAFSKELAGMRVLLEQGMEGVRVYRML